MSQYYMAVNGQQTGPFEKYQLLANGLTPDTPVWTEGMTDWAPASTRVELQDLFQPASNPLSQPYGYSQPAGNPYSQPQGPTPYYGQNNNITPNQSFMNWMPWAIIATVCGILFSGCLGLIFGIIGITKASAANRAYQSGDITMANDYNSSARTWTIVSFFFSIIGIIAIFIMFATGFYSSFAYMY